MNLLRFPAFAAQYAYELIVANLQVARIVISRDLDATPGLVAVPVELRGYRLLLLANMVTLTPGTVSVDVSRDGSVLYVHALNLSTPDDLRNDVTDVQRRIVEVFGR